MDSLPDSEDDDVDIEEHISNAYSMSSTYELSVSKLNAVDHSYFNPILPVSIKPEPVTDPGYENAEFELETIDLKPKLEDANSDGEESSVQEDDYELDGSKDDADDEDDIAADQNSASELPDFIKIANNKPSVDDDDEGEDENTGARPSNESLVSMDLSGCDESSVGLSDDDDDIDLDDSDENYSVVDEQQSADNNYDGSHNWGPAVDKRLHFFLIPDAEEFDLDSVEMDEEVRADALISRMRAVVRMEDIVDIAASGRFLLT